MSNWVPLAPSTAGALPHGRFSVLKPSKPSLRSGSSIGPSVGRWPESVIARIIHFLPIPDIPNIARCNRSLARLVFDDSGWKWRCQILGVNPKDTIAIHPVQTAHQPSDTFEDVDFGDFQDDKAQNIRSQDLLDFDNVPLPSKPTTKTGFFALSAATATTPGPFYLAYKAHHLSLLPLCRHLRSSPSPSSTLSLLFPTAVSLPEQAECFLALLLFLSPLIQPLHDWGFLRQALLAAADRFDSACLVAFEGSDAKNDEEGMRAAAASSWKVWNAGGGKREQWECGRVWIEKREVFYETNKWDPLENIVKVQPKSGSVIRQLDFTPMDSFITHVLETFRLDATRAVRVFPTTARVVLSFCERVANDVIGEYVQSLLAQLQIVSQDLFLQATAATFVQSWKLVDVTIQVDPSIPPTSVEDIIYRMFETNMDEYLDEETEWIKRVLEGICHQWEESRRDANGVAPSFLASDNPDQMKRNVLAGFKDVLLLPVTIVPRTVTYGVSAIGTVGSHAVSGLAMLNPQKWSTRTIDTSAVDAPNTDDTSVEQNEPLELPETETASAFDKLQLLVSLDTALELIHADRDALKRVETFANYPGKYGYRVRETIEEIFILMLKAAGDRHIAPGFDIATRQMSTYKPDEASTSVAPLLQFFELVHVGDTIQSMIQVYFDKDLAKYVDKTDFLNSVMREKKRFEAVLDDAVASGLNAGIEVLMNQVEHIIQVKTGPREYYPDKGTPMELGPTEGCQAAIACLEMHCNLLRGSTSKEVLEVFYQEVGIRLQGILQRHLKRQIISLEGGFQIIADLNTYHAFIASLKQQRITDDFANLKMLGHVYIVSDAKDLAQIVRDVTRYGGTFRPEDIYEFIQRRSDWKKIEKTVDKAMYALSVRDDCVIM